jgi:hypothetical protein
MVKASSNVTPIAVNSIATNRRAIASSTRPCIRVPRIAPVTAPGTADMARFHGTVAIPPYAMSCAAWVFAAPAAVLATTTVEVAAATGTGNRDRRTGMGTVASPPSSPNASTAAGVASHT